MKEATLSTSKSIGQRLKKARLFKNLTQAKLAQNAGVSERSLRSLENGENIQTDALFRVLGELGYLEDLEMVLSRPKPTTFEEHQAIGQGRHKVRLRARMS